MTWAMVVSEFQGVINQTEIRECWKLDSFLLSIQWSLLFKDIS